MKKEEPKFRKVTMNIPLKIWQELEQRQEENGTSITSEILNLVRFGLKQEQAVEMLPDLIVAFKEQQPSKKTKKAIK